MFVKEKKASNPDPILRNTGCKWLFNLTCRGTENRNYTFTGFRYPVRKKFMATCGIRSRKIKVR